MGRPKGAKNKKKISDATLAEYGVSPLLTHLDHEAYWKGIADAERAKPVAERDHALLEKAMDREAQAARDAGPYVHAKRATAAAQANDKERLTVIRAPRLAESNEEWIAMSCPLEHCIEERITPVCDDPRMKPLIAAYCAEKGFGDLNGKLVPLNEVTRPEPTAFEIQVEKKVKAANEAIMRATGRPWEPGDPH